MTNPAIAIHQQRHRHSIHAVLFAHHVLVVKQDRERHREALHPPVPHPNTSGIDAQVTRGLIGRALGNNLILSPTLIMEEPMIDQIEAILRESIQTVSSSLGI